MPKITISPVSMATDKNFQFPWQQNLSGGYNKCFDQVWSKLNFYHPGLPYLKYGFGVQVQQEVEGAVEVLAGAVGSSCLQPQ